MWIRTDSRPICIKFELDQRDHVILPTSPVEEILEVERDRRMDH